MSGTARAQNKKNQGQGTTAVKATPQDYAQLAKLKSVAGSLYYVEPGGKSLTLRVTIPQMQRNPNYRPPRTTTYRNNNYGNRNYRNSSGHYNPQQHMASMMSRYQQIMRTRNPIQRQIEMQQLAMQMQQMEAQAMMQFQMQYARMQMQEMQQMAQVMQQIARTAGNPANQPYKVVNTQKDFELEIQDKASVRRLTLPVEYDDMGNVKKYTKAELAELRGTESSKPGYAAKLDDLQPGQDVTLYLTPPSKQAAADLGTTQSNRSTVRMIVVMRDPNASLASKN